jgi:alpha-L-fucosidase 2
MEMRDTKSQNGWGCAWRVSLWARLYDSTNAYKWLKTLIGEKTELNMFDKPSVQLDGNFGGTAGIIEMLLQSQNGEVHLLPALPAVWPDGSIRGLRARGGFQVDLQWKNGTLERATVFPIRGGACRIRYGDKLMTRQVMAGKAIIVTPENFSHA